MWQLLLDLLPLSASHPCRCHIDLPKEVRPTCQLLWLPLCGSPPVPFLCSTKPITILQIHYAVYAAGLLYKFSPLLGIPFSLPCPIHLSHLRIHKASFLLSEAVPEPPKVSWRVMYVRTSYLVSLFSPYCQFTNSSQTDLPSCWEASMAFCHMHNKIQLLTFTNRTYVIRPPVSPTSSSATPLHSHDFSYTCLLAVSWTFHTYSQLYRGSPRPYHPAQWFSRKTHRTQHIIIFTAVIYSCKRIQKCMGWNLGKLMQASKGSRPGESHSICLISPATSCDNTCECCLPGKLIKDQVPAVF